MNYIDHLQDASAFALIKKQDTFQVVRGQIQHYDLLAQIPDNTISLLPFSQVKEKGYAYVGEELPIICLCMQHCYHGNYQELLQQLPDKPIEVGELSVDMSDTAYAKIVQDIITEIKQGEGCNFVVSRSFNLPITNHSRETMLSLYKQLIIAEPYAYMTFLFYDGEQYFIGASPECHLHIEEGRATMNPISGTLPKSRLDELEDFLQDPKEIYELHKVVDEEIKMMARICEEGGQVQGPFIKEMQALIHTEYKLSGKLTIPILDALRVSLYAPTLTGGPIANACRIIAKYEKTSRRYYGTALVIKKKHFLDSCITIRTAEIDSSGIARIRAGASIVIDSDPVKEAQETRVKAQGMLSVLQGQVTAPISLPKINETILKQRNITSSQFLLNKQTAQQFAHDKTCLLLDHGDDFIYVLQHMLHTLSIQTKVTPFSQLPRETLDAYDAIILGPGPGNPNTMDEEVTQIQKILQSDTPLMGICLGHQLIARALGMDVVQKPEATQGCHMHIDIFGTPYLMGYYNSFAVQARQAPKGIASITGQDGYQDVLKGPNVFSVQFHPESILSQYGYGCIQRILEGLGVL